jgi:hypothetical protein
MGAALQRQPQNDTKNVARCGFFVVFLRCVGRWRNFRKISREIPGAAAANARKSA